MESTPQDADYLSANMMHFIKCSEDQEELLRTQENKLSCGDAGEIYAAYTTVLPALHKIGFSCLSAEKRIAQLSKSTAAAEPFFLLCSARVPDARTYEKAVHLYFSDARIYGKKKEFFAVDKLEIMDLFGKIKGEIAWDAKSIKKWNHALTTSSPKTTSSSSSRSTTNIAQLLMPSVLMPEQIENMHDEANEAQLQIINRQIVSQEEMVYEEEAHATLMELRRNGYMQDLSSKNAAKELHLKRAELKFKRDSLQCLVDGMKACAELSPGNVLDEETKLRFHEAIVNLVLGNSTDSVPISSDSAASRLDYVLTDDESLTDGESLTDEEGM